MITAFRKESRRIMVSPPLWIRRACQIPYPDKALRLFRLFITFAASCSVAFRGGFHCVFRGFGFLFAFLDPGGRDDMLALGDIEQSDAGRPPAEHPQRLVRIRLAPELDRHPDHLRLVGDEHELLAVAGREARDDRTVALDIVDV